MAKDLRYMHAGRSIPTPILNTISITLTNGNSEGTFVDLGSGASYLGSRGYRENHGSRISVLHIAQDRTFPTPILNINDIDR